MMRRWIWVVIGLWFGLFISSVGQTAYRDIFQYGGQGNAGVGIAPSALTDGSSIAVNAHLSNTFTLTITGTSHTISNPTNEVTGQPVDFIITQNATGGFSPLWGTHFTFPGGGPSLNTAANAVSVISCKVQTANAVGGIICLAGPQAQGTGASFSGSPTDPTGAGTSGTAAMMGMGSTCTVTPATTGRINFTFDGTVASATIADGGTIALRYGTGTAPANAAAATGTVLGNSPQYLVSTTAARYPYALNRVVTGLTVGTAYWFDVSLTPNVSVVMTIRGNTCTAIEY
jgi:hypothetical protein